MARKKKRGKVEVEGLVCLADGDPWAEVSIVTDLGEEILVEPGSTIDSTERWVDAYVKLRGRMVASGEQQFLRVERAERIHDDWGPRSLMDHSLDWRLEDADWDDGEDEYEDHY